MEDQLRKTKQEIQEMKLERSQPIQDNAIKSPRVSKTETNSRDSTVNQKNPAEPELPPKLVIQQKNDFKASLDSPQVVKHDYFNQSLRKSLDNKIGNAQPTMGWKQYLQYMKEKTSF